MLSVNTPADELKAFFFLNNLFREGQECALTFQRFRQLFFPHLTVSGLDPRPESPVALSFAGDSILVQEEMHAIMKTLENNIRRILTRDYTSVRKAFLDLD
jgi:hypothetical protein